MTLLNALSFVPVALLALMFMAIACERLSARFAWIGLALLVATVATAVTMGWPTV